MILYHATLESNIASILKEGLLCKHHGVIHGQMEYRPPKAVYLSRLPQSNNLHANLFATASAKKEEVCVLQVDSDKLDKTKFVPDDCFFYILDQEHLFDDLLGEFYEMQDEGLFDKQGTSLDQEKALLLLQSFDLEEFDGISEKNREDIVRAVKTLLPTSFGEQVASFSKNFGLSQNLAEKYLIKAWSCDGSNEAYYKIFDHTFAEFYLKSPAGGEIAYAGDIAPEAIIGHKTLNEIKVTRANRPTGSPSF